MRFRTCTRATCNSAAAPGFSSETEIPTYGQERISETYYTLHIVRGISIAGDFQEVWRPGYNQLRGPVTIYSFRIHLEDGLQAFRNGRH